MKRSFKKYVQESNLLEVSKYESNFNGEENERTWGTRSNSMGSTYKAEKKRYFNIVWRDVTAKKHKTWKGDGTLEVNLETVQGVLKDEDGKYLACSNKVNINDLQPDTQLIVGSKEIEIQKEVIGDEEITEMRKRRVISKLCDKEDWVSPDERAQEKKTPKGAFIFKPNLVLKELKTTTRKTLCNKLKYLGNTQYICFIKPSELQEYLFQKVYHFYNENKLVENSELQKSLDVIHILEEICNHPSFLTHKCTINELRKDLTSSIPDCNEMGPFDSGKVEFVQQFLSKAQIQDSGSCLIIGEKDETLNMLQGLCDFLNIKHRRLTGEKENKLQRIQDYSVLLLASNDVKYIENLGFCNHIIIFESVCNILEMFEQTPNTLKNNVCVYYLITIFSVEELYIYKYLNNNKNLYDGIDAFFKEIAYSNSNNDLIPCYIYSKMGGSDETIRDWQFKSSPFTLTSLENMSLINAVDNLRAVLAKSTP